MIGKKPTRQVFYLVLDGLGDDPCVELGGRTPLEVAKLPHFDKLAREGQVFRLDLRDRTGQVTTSQGQFALLGYDEEDGTPRRGPVEAAGIGLALRDGDVAWRANFATFDEKGRIVDRRAGRIREGGAELCRALNGMELGDGVTARLRAGTDHRVALVLRGPGLGSGVSDSDAMHTSDTAVLPLEVVPTDGSDEAATRTAAKLRQFLSRACRILEDHPLNQKRRESGLLPANGLLTRQAGRHMSVPSLEERYGLRCVAVSGDDTVIGVMRLLGCETVKHPSFTANIDTDLGAKFIEALRGIDNGYDIALLHIKAIDILSHDRQPVRQIAFLQEIDARLGAALEKLPSHAIVAVGSDHSTSSTSGDHVGTHTPAMLYGANTPASAVPGFHEAALENAEAEILEGRAFFDRVLQAMTTPQP